MKKTVLFASLASSSLLFLSGCATPERYGNSATMFEQGQYGPARELFKDQKRNPEKDGDKYVLDDLIVGAASHAAMDFDAAIAAFDSAETGIKAQDEALLAGKGVAQASAILSNDNALPYPVQQYDKIMANTYKAIDQLAKGEVDAARVELNRAGERQRMCKVHFAKLIQKQEEEAAAAKRDAKFADAFKIVEESIASPETAKNVEAYRAMTEDWGSYADFMNPFTTFLRGLFLALYGEDASDYEEACRLMRQCHAVSPSQAVRVAYGLADRFASRASGKADARNLVWVVFENGMGPAREEHRFDLLIPAESVMYVGVALPKLRKGREAYPCLSIRDGAVELAKTTLLCDMDAVVADEFRAQLPAIVARNLTSAALKAALQVVATKAAEKKGGQLGAMAMGMGGSALSAASTQADTRIWSQLPKNIQVAVLNRPASGKLSLCVPGGTQPLAEVSLKEQAASIVYVKTPAPGVPPSVAVLTAR